MKTFDFTTEATTYIRFPSDRQYSEFCDYTEGRYQSSMVQLRRYKVTLDGTTTAILNHARGLGAELRGAAAWKFQGETVEQ